MLHNSELIRSFPFYQINKVFEWNLVQGLWITEPVQKQALISPLTDPKTTGNDSEKERYEIGKYTAIHRSRAAERKFHTKEKPLSESNARRFSKLYKEEILKAQKNNRDVNRNLSVFTTWTTVTLWQSGSDGAETFTFLSKDWRTCIFCCRHFCRKCFNCTKSSI